MKSVIFQQLNTFCGLTPFFTSIKVQRKISLLIVKFKQIESLNFKTINSEICTKGNQKLTCDNAIF